MFIFSLHLYDKQFRTKGTYLIKKYSINNIFMLDFIDFDLFATFYNNTLKELILVNFDFFF